MSICTQRLRNTSNALTLRMSGEQIRLQVLPILFGVNSWITLMSAVNSRLLVRRQKMHGSKCAAANLQSWHLMASGRSQMLATRNFGDWHTVVGEVPWSSVAKTRWTVTASLYCTRWGITSQCRSSCFIRDRPHSYFRVLLTRRAAAFWTCCNLSPITAISFNPNCGYLLSPLSPLHILTALYSLIVIM